MDVLVALLARLGFVPLLWLFFIVFAVHELEEWNIDRFERQCFTGLPPSASDRSVHVFIAFMIGLGLVWVTAATLSGSPTAAAWIFLPAVAFMIMNALQHIFWSLYFRRYAPGVVSSAVLLIPLGAYIIVEALRLGYAPTWYAALLGVLVAAGLTQTVLAGNRMLPIIQAANALGVLLAGEKAR